MQSAVFSYSCLNLYTSPYTNVRFLPVTVICTGRGGEIGGGMHGFIHRVGFPLPDTSATSSTACYITRNSIFLYREADQVDIKEPEYHK